MCKHRKLCYIQQSFDLIFDFFSHYFRTRLNSLLVSLNSKLHKLLSKYSRGIAIKEGKFSRFIFSFKEQYEKDLVKFEEFGLNLRNLRGVCTYIFEIYIKESFFNFIRNLLNYLLNNKLFRI